jgi:hypothetical protein
MKRLGIAVAALAMSGTALGLAPVAGASTAGDRCSQWMKIGTDSATGARMFCAAPPGTDDSQLTWTAWSSGAWGDAPAVGPVGSSCGTLPTFTFGQSSDGYVVWCVRDQQTLLPGNQTGYASTPTWSLYSP